MHMAGLSKKEKKQILLSKTLGQAVPQKEGSDAMIPVGDTGDDTQLNFYGRDKMKASALPITDMEKKDGRVTFEIIVERKTIDQKEVVTFGVRKYNYQSGMDETIEKDYSSAEGLIEYCLEPTLKGIKL